MSNAVGKTIALAAGGTGGHMFPAQSLAEELGRRGWQRVLVTDARGLRYADNFPAEEVVELAAANPNVSGLGAKVSMARAMLSGVVTARTTFARWKPSVAVGFGGYPSAPGLFAAVTMGIPLAIHEQNAILGRVNRKAAPRARLVAHGFPTLDRLPATKAEVTYTGNPVRDAVAAVAGAPYPESEPEGPIHLLIFGGSQGARLFGTVFPAALASLPEALRRRLRVTHQVEEAAAAEVNAIYKKAGIEATLAAFFKDLPERIAASHLVVARAGASSVTELGVIGRPSLLVPLGIAMDDHQRHNAQVLVEAGAADIVLEKDLSAETAAAALLPRLADTVWRQTAARAAQSAVVTNAAAQLADRVDALFGRGQNPR